MTSRIVATLACALAALAVVAAAAGAPSKKSLPFKATYSGTATTQQAGTDVTITAKGRGSGTLLGSAALTGNGKSSTSAQPCAPLAGPGSMVGAGGTKLAFTVLPASSGCGDEAGETFAISGHAKVTSTAGKLAKYRGTLKFTGTWDRGSGAFTVAFKGTLSR
jgi:hypothetical protein